MRTLSRGRIKVNVFTSKNVGYFCGQLTVIYRKPVEKDGKLGVHYLGRKRWYPLDYNTVNNGEAVIVLPPIKFDI